MDKMHRSGLDAEEHLQNLLVPNWAGCKLATLPRIALRKRAPVSGGEEAKNRKVPQNVNPHSLTTNAVTGLECVIGLETRIMKLARAATTQPRSLLAFHTSDMPTLADSGLASGGILLGNSPLFKFPWVAGPAGLVTFVFW